MRSIVTTFTYDVLNRLTQKSYSDGTPTATFTYDATSADGLTIQYATGRLVKAATSTTRTVQSYDNLGRVKDLWQCTPANCGSGWFQMTYGYNEISAATSQTNPMGFTLTQTYNAAGIMKTLTSSWSDAQHPATLVTIPDSPTDKGYNPGGAMIKAYLGNGLIETRQFNVRGQPTEMRTYSTASCTPMPSCQDKLKLNYSFVDAQGKNNGNVMSWTGWSKLDAQGQQLNFNRTYGYDELNRLKTMASPGENCTGLNWDYDIWGNRLHQNNGGGTCNEHHPGTASLQNRITTQGYVYDAAGNLTAEPGKTYQYDAENRMTSIGNGCPNTLCYTYDASGKRIRKRVNSTITDYIYDGGGALVAERQSTNAGSTWSWTKGYVQFAGQMLAQYNGVISTSGATTYFAHKDHLGSTRLLTTVSASVHETYDFLPFGEPIIPPTPSSPATTNQFTGQQRDPESGLDYMVARYFSAAQGRFLATDPVVMTPPRLRDPQQLNQYAYVRNNPLRFIDPTGEELTISGGVQEAQKQLCELIGGDCKRITYDEKTNTITVDLTGINLSENEGASLLNDLVSSEKHYDLYLGDKIPTKAGARDLEHIENLDNNPDSRYRSGKTDKFLPPLGKDDQVGINDRANRKSETSLLSSTLSSRIFHELAEAYAKVDKGMQYEKAHEQAVQREQKLREQRPSLKLHNPGSGPGDAIIRK